MGSRVRRQGAAVRLQLEKQGPLSLRAGAIGFRFLCLYFQVYTKLLTFLPTPRTVARELKPKRHSIGAVFSANGVA